MPGKVGLDFNLTDLAFGIFGFLLVLMMILRPEGLLPERRRKMELTEGIGADEALVETAHRGRGAARTADGSEQRTSNRRRRRPTAADGDILVADRITKIFGGLVANDDVSFAIPRRSIVSIIGPNGAGKTTFFNMLTGLYRPTFGRIAFNGDDITGRRPDQIMKAGHGAHVPEHPPVRDDDARPRTCWSASTRA